MYVCSYLNPFHTRAKKFDRPYFSTLNNNFRALIHQTGLFFKKINLQPRFWHWIKTSSSYRGTNYGLDGFIQFV